MYIGCFLLVKFNQNLELRHWITEALKFIIKRLYDLKFSLHFFMYSTTLENHGSYRTLTHFCLN
jgi:hypothetical protein